MRKQHQQNQKRQNEIRQKLQQKEKKSSIYSGRNIAISAFVVIILGAIALSVLKNQEIDNRQDIYAYEADLPAKEEKIVKDEDVKQQDNTQNQVKEEEKKNNKDNDDEGEDDEEYYQIPSLKSTIAVNEQLIEDTYLRLSNEFNLSSKESAVELTQVLYDLFNSLEEATLPVFYKNLLEQKQKPPDFTNPLMGIYRDETYCSKSDVYMFAHPEEIQSNITLFSDYGDEYTRDFLFGNFSKVASEVYGYVIPKEYYFRESFAVEINVTQFYFQTPRFVSSFLIGKELGCLFQGLNKIPNSGSLTRKEGLARSYRSFMEELKKVQTNPGANTTLAMPKNINSYSEKCIQEFKFLPETFNLNLKDQCSEFFAEIDSEKFKQASATEGFQFIAKLGANVHQGQGIQVLTREILEPLWTRYEGGKKCGNVTENNAQLIQRYLNDPLLLGGVKFEVRVHFVVVSVDPLVIYAQDKAGVAICALPYDRFDQQIQRHLCVYEIARRLLSLSDSELLKISGKTREQFMGSFSYQHTLDSLQVALEAEGSVPPNWVNEHLIPSIFRNFIHSLLMVRGNFFENTRFYEMYAPDILIDKTTKQPYVLEYNTNPRMVNTSSFVHDWNLSTIKDMVMIKMAEVRSKYFRVRKIVKEYILELKNNQKPDKNEYLERLIKASSTKIEPQFNVDHLLKSYVKIYDGHNPDEELKYKGTKIWNKECAH